MQLRTDSLTYDYYHSDHLGSASYITDLDGQIVQHIEYVPFGEVFLEERNNHWNTQYLFNSKELDEETGLYYYGAKVSQWLSVDPLALYDPVKEVEHYIDGEHNGGYNNPRNMSVYGYCYQNPVVYIDPNGKQTHLFHGSGNWTESEKNDYFNEKGGVTDFLRNRSGGQINSHSWNGSVRSSQIVKEGNRISKEVIKSIVKNIKGGQYTGPGITIGGHSNGGNLATVVTKKVYAHLKQMIKDGELDKMPVMNLLKINSPVNNGSDFKLDGFSSMHINVIEVDSKFDLVKGLGTYFFGEGALTEFSSDADHKIEYKDQYKNNTGYGIGNHLGQDPKNVKEWSPHVNSVLETGSRMD